MHGLASASASTQKHCCERLEILLWALRNIAASAHGKNKNTNMEDMPQCTTQKLLDNFI